jgi:hypothetical protein
MKWFSSRYLKAFRIGYDNVGEEEIVGVLLHTAGPRLIDYAVPCMQSPSRGLQHASSQLIIATDSVGGWNTNENFQTFLKSTHTADTLPVPVPIDPNVAPPGDHRNPHSVKVHIAS